MKKDGQGESMMKQGFKNEGKKWEKNGRVMMFLRKEEGEGGKKILKIEMKGSKERKIKKKNFD